jgi:branched-chain amino acid transport system ATP-binding protein
MLAIGRALVTNPKLLLLDEPSAGLAVGIVRSMIEIIARIRASGVAILLVEQNIEVAQALAESCVVLAAGRVAWRGGVRDAVQMQEIREAYFA